MLSLIANNAQVALSPGTKLRYEVTSPIFSSGVITAAVIYPFDLPIIGNEILFECAHFLESNRKYKTIPCTLSFGGTLICAGELVLSKINSKNLRASIIGNAFAIDSKETIIRDIELPSETIDSDPHHPRDISMYATKIVKEEIPSMFQFPKMWAELFYGSEDEDGRSNLNPDYGQSYLQEIDGKFVNNYSGASVIFGFPYNEIREDPNPTNIFSLVPCPYLYLTLQKLIESQGYQVFGNFLQDPAIQKILISSNTPIDKLHPAYFVKASNFTDEQYFEFSGRVKIDNETDPPNSDDDNCWDPISSEYEIMEAGYHHIKLTCDYFLEVSQATPYKRCRIRIKINEATSEYIDQDTYLIETWVPGVFETTIWIPNNWIGLPLWFETLFLESFNGEQPWDGQAGRITNVLVEITNVSKSEFNNWSNIINLADHLPNISFSEFLNAIKDTFSLAIWIDNNTKEVQFGFTKDIINSPYYLDLTEHLIEDSPEIEINEPSEKEFIFNFKEEYQSTEGKTFIGPFASLSQKTTPDRLNVLTLIENLNVLFHYTIDENNKPDWFYFADNFFPYTTGDNADEISVKLSPVTMHQKNETLQDDIICPKLIEVGNSEAFNPEVSEMPFRIMLWLGMQENNSGYQYPMASCTGLNYKGERILSLDLNWSGQYGIINNYYKPYLDLISNSENVTVNFSITPIELNSILKLFRPQQGKECRKIRLKNKTFIPEKASFQFSETGIDSTEIKLVSKNNQI